MPKSYWEKYPYHKNISFCVWRKEFVSDVVCDNVEKIQSVLEVGCSSGGNLLFINKKCPEIKLSGIDYVESAIEYGKKVEKINADLKCMNLFDLKQIPSKSYDLVFTCGTLIYLNPKDIPGVLKELKRIAKRFILNIELVGDETTYYKRIKFKYIMWGHRFRRRYNDIGILVNIYDMNNLLKLGFKIKSAKHLIVANLGEEKLHIRDFYDYSHMKKREHLIEE